MAYFSQPVQPQHSLERVPCLEIDHEELDIRETIDRGSYGVVKIALWRDDEVAVKIFETQSEIEAFWNEVEVLASVSHPNIIELYGASKSKLPYYMVMELANQGSLYNVLHKMRDIDYDEDHVFTWCTQISLAMSYLHDLKPKPIIHRDLKSSNVLLKDQVVKLCDFGTACDNHTLMTNAKGTVAWMAPEVISTTSYNEKCDVYSFGVLIWELIMRKIPFEKYNQYQIMRKVTENQRPTLPDTVPSSIRLLITQCWSQDPETRPGFKQISALLGMIKPHLKPLTVHEPPSPPRFPDTPSSSTPSPVSGPTNYTLNNGSIRPLEPLPHVAQSCALFSEHSQIYEDLSALLSHVDRKRGTMKCLEEQYKELVKQEKIIEQSKEEKQIRLTMLRSENDSLNSDIHGMLT